MIFVTMIAAISLGSYLWAMHNVTPQQFEGPFINNHVPFNFYRNVLLPDMGMGLLIYLSYLFISLYHPAFIIPKKI